MKLTQKTLLQCFDRSVRITPVVVEEQSDDDIIECEINVDVPLPRRNESNGETKDREDFLLPVHIRQNDSKSDEILPDSDLSRWNCIDDDTTSTLPSDWLTPLDRFSSILHPNPIESNELESLEFRRISSEERQMELFQHYIDDDLSSYGQTVLNWSLMFKQLKEYRAKALEQNQYDQFPWTEIYRARHSNSYLGAHRKEIQRFNDWFRFWSEKLNGEDTKKTLRQGRKRRRDHDEDQSDEDFMDHSNLYFHRRAEKKVEHAQLVFLHGSGTTSLVYALAEEHQFKITEINGSQSRAKTILLKQLEQSTSHHYLSIKRCPSDMVDRSRSISVVPVKKKAKSERGTIVAFFNEKKKKKKTSEPVDEEEKSVPMQRQQSKSKKNVKIEENSLSTVQMDKASLILFDEIETLSSDENFWSCLKKLLETAKKPIILTSNNRTNPDEALVNLEKIGNFELIEIPANEPELIHCYLRLILLVEMFEISSYSALKKLVQSCSNDLRRSLLTLQFLAQSSPSISSSSAPSSSNSSNEFLPSSIYETLFYTHLAEQWTPSILKDQFDELTKLYQSRYEQSSSNVLMKHLEKETKRNEIYQTLRSFCEEQHIDMITDRSSIYLDYRPFLRQICLSEQDRRKESNSSRRLRHSLSFRGSTLNWSDYAILCDGLDLQM